MLNITVHFSPDALISIHDMTDFVSVDIGDKHANRVNIFLTDVADCDRLADAVGAARRALAATKTCDVCGQVAGTTAPHSIDCNYCGARRPHAEEVAR